ncbi:carboxypeptidase regulatory-like domain-containing protein [Thioalkalicoccus limnaeus]|uniref:Carboxypeptidase regulatory-like domain-containing protein n=1 Tax=Thioalkalicoccus limnaeus TaxID=120681 RepID=A0ABV4BLL2_9GAMM
MAVDWLLNQQQDNGQFSSSRDEVPPYQSTTEALRALDALALEQESASDKGLTYLGAVSEEGSLPYLSRWLIAQRLEDQSAADGVAAVIAHQNDDGGFGARPGDQSSVLDTLDALEALAGAGVDGAVIGRATGYLLQRQHVDGSFSATPSSPPSVYLTSRALSVLQPYRFDYDLSAPLQRAADFLWNNRQQGLWGETWESAWALLALVPITTDSAAYGFALDQLLARQTANGSWDDSVFATALVLRAMQAPRTVIVPPAPGLAAIAGRVIDESTGEPLNGVMVTAGSDEGFSVTVSTGDDGRFSLSALEPQSYILNYAAEGYGELVQSLSVEAGQFVDLGTVRLPAAPQVAVISGRVSDAVTGLPVTAQIEISGDADVSVSSGEDGRYLVMVPPGEILIEVVAPGYHPTLATATVQAGQRVAFSPTLYPADGQIPDGPVSVSGTLLDADTGLPVEGASITLAGAAVATTSDGSGTFVLTDLEAGDIGLRVTHAGYQSVAVNLVAVAGSDVDIGMLRLVPAPDPATSLHGRVYDLETGQPVAGATVTVGGLSSSTDEHGQYQIAGIDTLAFDVSATATGYLTASSALVLQQHGSVRLDIPLQKAAPDGIRILRLAKDRTAYEAFEEVLLVAEVENIGGEPQRVVMAATVQGIGSDLREDFVIPVPGGPRDARFTIDPGEVVVREFSWSTRNWPPGDYQMLVQVLTEHRDVVLAEQAVAIHVVETRHLRALNVYSAPTQLVRGEEVELEFLAGLESLSNVDAMLTLEYALVDPDGNPVHQDVVDIEVMAAASSSLVPLGTIAYRFDEAGSYPIHVLNVSGMAVTAIRADDLIVSPNIRVDGHLGADPDRITPGDSKSVHIRLRIVGAEDSP